MSAKTGIEWTNRTWNPTTGCDKVSAGCKHCYAEPLALRLQRMGNARYTNGFDLTLHQDKIGEPLGWRTPELVFVNSMSDLLHKDVPTAFILDCFDVMARANWHTYQILTKRPERWQEVTAAVIARLGYWPNNVLPGTSGGRSEGPRAPREAGAGR
jgi:protein gp37